MSSGSETPSAPVTPAPAPTPPPAPTPQPKPVPPKPAPVPPVEPKKPEPAPAPTPEKVQPTVMELSMRSAAMLASMIVGGNVATSFVQSPPVVNVSVDPAPAPPVDPSNPDSPPTPEPAGDFGQRVVAAFVADGGSKEQANGWGELMAAYGRGLTNPLVSVASGDEALERMKLAKDIRNGGWSVPTAKAVIDARLAKTNGDVRAIAAVFVEAGDALVKHGGGN